MTPYPKYKDTTIEWISEIPSTWQLTKLKHVVDKIGSGVTPRGGSEAYQESGIPLLRSQNIHFDGLRLDDVAFISEEIHDDMSNSKVKSGDVLLNITGASIGRCFYWPAGNQEANVNQHVCIVRPSAKADTRFIYNFLCSGIGQFQIDYCQNGANREGLSNEQLGGFFFPLPPLPEQRAIAAFLDDKTTKIDRLLQAKRRQIALLKEERTALINQAVTRGLDPDVPLKDSCVEWIGMIPRHWEVKKLKWISKVISKGTTPSTEGQEILPDGPIRFLKAENIFENQVVDYPRFFIDENTNLVLQRSTLDVRDILIVIAGATIGKVAVLTEEFYPSNTNQAVCFIRPLDEVNERHIWYWLQTSMIKEVISLDSVQAAQPNLSMEKIGNFSIPWPPQHEIDSIIIFVDARLHSIDTTISKIEKEIDLLQEYRTALISEVVTGKLRV